MRIKGHRFGFNGKEKVDEVYGDANLSDYGFRIYDPRISRFLSVDPLGSEYPWYTPYQFAGNNPVWFIDIDGAEPGVFLGTTQQVVTVDTQNGVIATPNWKAYELTSLQQAKTTIQTHISNGNKVKAVYLQVHGTAGSFAIFSGANGKLENEPVARGTVTNTDDGTLSGFQLSWYLAEKDRIGKIENKGQRGREMQEFNENPEAKKINEFVDFLDVLDDGTTVIIGGCHTGQGQEGDELLGGLKKLSGGRLDFVASGDYVGGGTFYATSANNKVLDVGLSNFDVAPEATPGGWKDTSSGSTEVKGKNLQLNSSGPVLFQHTK